MLVVYLQYSYSNNKRVQTRCIYLNFLITLELKTQTTLLRERRFKSTKNIINYNEIEFKSKPQVYIAAVLSYLPSIGY